MTLNLTDAVLERRVWNRKVNNRLTRDTILRELPPYVPRDKIAIDVGAATGHITYVLAPLARRVVAFEAVEPVYVQLKKMERLRNVTTFNAAVSDFNGVGEIYVDDKRLSNSGFQDLVGGQKTQVLTVKLDSLFRETPVGFIKIDVEGTELDVLRGANDVLDHYRPALMVEIYEPFSKYPLDDIFVHLFERGYRCFSFARDKGLIEIPDVAAGVKSVRYDHENHDGDFLFT